MKGRRFANVIAVWNWWYKPIYMLVFSQYFSLSLHHLNDSIYIWNCCNQAQVFKQKINHEVFCDWNFCMKFFTTSSSKNIIATLRIVTIEISELTFLLILYFHVLRYSMKRFMECLFLKLWKFYMLDNYKELLKLQPCCQGAFSCQQLFTHI